MAKKRALPKSVAGFKVPKSLRKNRLLNGLVASPIGRKVLADALMAGAGAAASVLIQQREGAADGTKAGLRKGEKAISVAADAVESAVDAMMHVVTEAARSMLPADKHKKHAKQKGRPSESDLRH